MVWKGGEKEGLARLDHFLQNALGHYSDTRNNLIGADYSSKLSPWISNGSLGIRFIYQQVFPSKNKQVLKFIDEIFWRDYQRFFCMKAGNAMFSSYGIHDRTYMDWKNDEETIRRWKTGMTGIPLIDALMRELNVTGFMSNRGRQIVASYLAFDLKQDWRFGAYHFEEKLIDHDIQQNIGGWSAAAGLVGKASAFNVMLQSTRFDSEGEYIRMWVPELKNVPLGYIHTPWDMSKEAQGKCGL